VSESNRQVAFSREPSGERFYVVELDGYPINPGALKTGSGNRPRITCSVLDRFYCHREVARFEPDWRGGPGRPPREQRRVDTRHAASECAASLNALVAA
jgi:hypothetical protein